MSFDRTFGSLAARAERRPSAVARLSFGVYAALIVYASLAPWAGWRDLGIGLFSWLDAPWPAHVTRFDFAVNVLGYFPFGALAVLALYPRWRNAIAIAIAIAAGLLLSGAIESLQTLLPQRIASQVDLLANVCGTAVGAAMAARFAEALLERGRLAQLRDRWFAADVSAALVLLALWPLAQIHPASMLFGLGPADGWLLDSIHELGWPHLPGRGTWTPTDFVLAEAVATTAGVLAPGLVAAAVMLPPAPRIRLLLLLVAAALGIKTVAYGLRFGPELSLAWLTPGAVAGLSVGLLALVVASTGSSRPLARLALLASAGLFVAVGVVPDNPYFAHWLVQWRTGKLAHFNAVGDWIALAWPFALVLWLLAFEVAGWRERRK